MLYAKKAPTGSSFTVARCLSDTLPGLLLIFIWEKWTAFFRISDAWCEKTKLGRYSDKAYVALLFLTNFIYFWFATETGQDGDFSPFEIYFLSAVISVLLFQATRLSNPGFVTPLDSDVPSKLPYCQQCRVHKLARSVHDKYTDRCIQRFDHYNLWLRCPIGSNNYRIYFFFLLAQFTNSYALWESIGKEVSYFWTEGSSQISLGIVAAGWVVCAFMSCCFFHFVLRSAYHVVCNITAYEVKNYGQLEYINFDPNYFNMFDRKWTENLTHFLTAYKKERPAWETVFKSPAASSGDILGVLLNATPDQSTTIISAEQQQSDDALIQQWLNQA